MAALRNKLPFHLYNNPCVLNHYSSRVLPNTGADQQQEHRVKTRCTFVFSVDNKILIVEILSSLIPELKMQGINSASKKFNALNSEIF